MALEIDGTRTEASVEGTGGSSHRVGLDWGLVPVRRVLHAFCDCGRFAKGKPCEHLWATLLALADTGPENQPTGKDRVGLRKHGESSWAELVVTPEPEDPSLQSASLPARPNARTAKRSSRAQVGKGSATAWRSQLDSLREAVEQSVNAGQQPVGASPDPSGIRFLVNTAASLPDGGLILDIFEARPSSGGSVKLRPASVTPEALAQLLRPEDSANGAKALPPLLTALPSEPSRKASRGRQPRHRPAPNHRGAVRRFRLPPELYEPVLPTLTAGGALGWWDGRPRSARHGLSWDHGAPWQLTLRLDTSSHTARIMGGLVRGKESVPVSDPLLVLAGATTPSHQTGPSFVVFSDVVARLETATPSDLYWIKVLRDLGDIVVPKQHLEEAIAALVEIPGLPRIEGPEEFQLKEERSPMRPKLVLESDAAAVLPNAPLLARQSFLYGETEVRAEDPRPSVVDWKERSFVQRDMEAEHKALLLLLEAGAEPVPLGTGHELQVALVNLPSVVEPLLAAGWSVEARGTSLRFPDPPSMRVESGTDWFELSGSTDFEGDRVELKEILEAISKGDRFVELEDGSRGLLPSSWMETYDSLAKLASDSTEEGLRFLSSQALLVDVLLTTMPPVDADGAFSKLREKLRSFDRIKPKKEPRGFVGELRTYQREGLAWLSFLREFGLGGVLADDMGLGKTVQVLALLRANRTPSKTTGLPSLVIAPRSVVYNWIDEAAKFTPSLKVVEYRGKGREALREKFSDFDIIVTTYGTLRRDIDFLATVEFDTLILDEAQAIKNRESLGAKASRLLRARNRLALTGTPIENHLGELGSIFEIVNPGLMGNLPRLEVLSSGRTASQQELKLVAEGIRPFILRRTKTEVLKDLPPKTEQILYCTLRREQQEIYDKLRTAYQGSLLGEIDGGKSKGSAIQVLEALLRLRQTACHPGLVNPEWEEAGSAKLDALFDHVSEVLEEGHKVIVFSQFTKLLGYVRRHLDEQGNTYAYLDGKTRDRGQVVERFQTDPECNLFLISLRAGGLGLNLTAAGYVFLLDPWWNPAVEAQAIDRAHRIGQTQPVFAYRMIARGTVEEKILELQDSKRKIVEAVLEGERHSMPNLTAADLRLLLS